MQNDDVSFVARFVSNVRSALCSCGADPSELAVRGEALGAAVSGGADSLSLLTALSDIAAESGVNLHVITVNHNIRPAEETGGERPVRAAGMRRLGRTGRSCGLYGP